MSTKRGRPSIKPHIKQLIYTRALRDKDIPRLALAVELRKFIKDEMGEVPPTEETMIKLISEGRNLPLTDEDEPWSIGASVQYVLPPEANKDLFDIWRASLAMGSPISIRQAKWIIHIRNLFPQSFPPGLNELLPSRQGAYSDKVNRNLLLIRQSWLYSLLERASHITGEKYFDTTNLDSAFMLNWERATALRLGKVSHLNYSQEALTKIEKFGTPLTSPSISVSSVEDAVWRSVRSKPPEDMKLMAEFASPDDVLQEEDDLVAAYWLSYLSKGPLWNNLPEQPEIQGAIKHVLETEPRGFAISSFPDDSMYSRQLCIRRKLLEWVKTDSDRRVLLHPVRTGSLIETWALANRVEGPGYATPPFNATLLKMVGYEVTPEQMETWLKLHEKELQALHEGFDLLPADARERFILDKQTFDDKEALEDVDVKAKTSNETRQRQIEQEFIDLVEQKGGPPDNKAGYKAVENFWLSIRDEWIKKYPEYKKKSPYGYLQWQEVETEYERLKASRMNENTG